MSIKLLLYSVLVIFALAMFSGCGSDDPSETLEYNSHSYFPHAVGNDWTYLTETDGQDNSMLKIALLAEIDSCGFVSYAAKDFRRYNRVDGDWDDRWYYYYFYLDGSWFTGDYPCNPEDRSVLEVMLINPDEYEVGDTLFSASGRPYSQYYDILVSKESQVETSAGIFNHCYAIQSRTSLGDYKYTYYAYGVGRILTRDFVLSTAEGADTTFWRRTELVDYHLYDENGSQVHQPVSSPTPEMDETGITPSEQLFSFYEDIPEHFLEQFEEYLVYYDYSYYFFDFNGNGERDKSYIEWQCPETDQPLLFDIYFGENPNAELILEDHYVINEYKIEALIEPGKTYYWRIDTKHQPGGDTAEGQVWSFTAASP